MANDYTTFWVGESYRKVFRAKNVDLSEFTQPVGAWRFKFFNGRQPEEQSKFADEVNQVRTDVDLIFTIPSNHFVEDMVGDIQYQVSLQDFGDQEPRYFTSIYVGKVEMPI